MKWEYLSGALSDFVDGNSDYIFVSAIIDDDHRINRWELVSIVQNIAYFKRPIKQILTEQERRLLDYDYYGMRWEYKVLKVLADTQEEREGKINELGDKGWELINVTSKGLAYFKRPIKEHSVVKQTFTKEHRRIIDYFGGKIA
jgi:hypothetical protein